MGNKNTKKKKSRKVKSKKKVSEAPSAELLTNEGLAYVTEHTLETIFSQPETEEEQATLLRAASEEETIQNTADSATPLLSRIPDGVKMQKYTGDSNGSEPRPLFQVDNENDLGHDARLERNHGEYMPDSTDEDDDEVSMKWYRDTVRMYENKKWYQRPTVHTLLAVMALKVICFTITLAPSMQLMMDKICASMTDTDGKCDMLLVQKEQGRVQSVVTTVSSALGLFTSGKYGELSDRFGRVFVFQINGAITILHVLLALYVFSPATSYNRWLVILAQCMESFSGGVMVLIATGNSYISDIVPPSQRMVSISVLMSIVYGTLGLGPLVGSFIIKSFGGNNFTPFYFAVIFSLLFNVVVYFFIVESRHHDARKFSQTERKELVEKNGNSVYATLLDVLRPLTHLWMPRTYSGSLIPRFNVLILLLMDIMFVASTQGCIPTIILYSMLKFKWGSVQLGYFMSIGGLGRALVLLVLVPQIVIFLKYLSPSRFKAINISLDRIDLFVLQFSVVFMFCSVATILFVQSNSSGLYYSAGLQALSAVLSPTIQSVVVKYASKKITGQVFGAIALLRHCVMLVVPLFFLQIYTHTVDKNPSLFLYVPFVCSIVCFVLTFFLRIVNDPEILRRPSQVFAFDEAARERAEIESQFQERRHGSNTPTTKIPELNRKNSVLSINSSDESPTTISNINNKTHRSIMERRLSVLNQENDV